MFDEKETGMFWVDGKKIYRKVFMITYGSSVNHNINNLDRVVSLYGSYYRNNTYVRAGF